MSDASSPHSEPFSVEVTRLFANRYMPDSGKRRLHEACDAIERLEEQFETLRGAAQEYVRVVNEHAEALADYAEDMDGDAEQIVSSLGFIGALNKGCLDPEEDSLAQALDVLAASYPASRQDSA